MPSVVKFEQEVEGEETLDNTKNIWQVGLFATALVAAIGLVAWITYNVGDMARLILMR